MSGGSMGTQGASRIAKEQLNVNNPYAHPWSAWGPKGLPPRSGTLMEVPFRFWGSVLGGACALAYGCYWLNRRMYTTTPESMTPDFQEKARRHGPVAERSGAPPVFLNPIYNRIPGYIRGPDDVAGA